MYLDLNTRGWKVPWRKLFYKNMARPRAQFTLWMTCHGRLATKNKLFKFGLLNNVSCCLCSNPEAIDHMLFGCVELKMVWKYFPGWKNIYHAPHE